MKSYYLRMLSALLACAFFAANAAAQAPTIDGTVAEANYATLGTSMGGPAPGFGAGHEINALKAIVNPGNLYLGVAGNVQNTNRIVVFIDSRTGGFNTGDFGRTGAPQGIDDFNSGTTFDTGFTADYALVLGTNGTGTYFADLFTLAGTAGGGGGTNVVLGSATVGTPAANFGANPANASQTQGFEVQLTRSTGTGTNIQINQPTVRLFAAYISDAGFLSNQFISPAGVSQGNYTGIPVNFNNEPPNPVNFVVNTFSVTNTNDTGLGSLRDALTNANASANVNATTPDIINFALGAGGPFTISPTSALPDITEAVNINGFSQAGSQINIGGAVAGTGCNGAATLQVVLNGANVVGSNGLTIASNGTISPLLGSTIQGLVINGFDGNGIEIASVNNIVAGNYIGTDAAGNAAVPNLTNGVIITSGATGNVIGGFSSSARNIISGNSLNGVTIAANNNAVLGNYIGTNALGSTDLGNGVDGVDITGRNNVIGGSSVIGGCAPGNLISGNDEDGVSISGLNTAINNLVQGNFIGTSRDGSADLGNTSQGVFINASSNFVGGSTVSTRNVISGNNGGGINIGGQGSFNLVRGNYVGTNAAGTGLITTGAVNNADGVRIDASANNNRIGENVPLLGGLQTAYGVNATNALVRFDPNPIGGVINATTVGTISGLQTGEQILGIDFRPANRQLYGLGSTSRLYIINTDTAVATQVGTTPFTPALSGMEYGFDFNPAVDLIRVISNTNENFRLNPNTGAVQGVDTNLNVTGTTAAAYYNNDVDAATGTILFDINSANDTLYIQNPPNNGTLVPVGAIGALGVNATDVNGFDINTSNGGNTALAALTVGGSLGLYSINLNSGVAASVGTINGVLNLRGLALEIASPEILPTYGLTSNNQLLRFGATRPGNVTGVRTATTTTITGLQTGESIVGIDFRPATRQLYGLGFTASGSAGRLYVISTDTGAATQIGTTGAFTLTGTEFGFDFNPTVDRIRVTSNTGQNLRLNPDNGALAASDTNLNGAATAADATAYTNNFAGTNSTVLYYIDSVSDAVYTTSNPNGGVLTSVGPLGFDATGVNGFDITTSGATNTAYAALTVSGGMTSNIFQINLTTGAPTFIGTIGGGVTIRGIATEIGATGANSAGNVISGNNVGVHIAEGSNNAVRGNFIGTGANGESDLGNFEAGVYIQQNNSTGNFIGGVNVGDGNRIQFNGDGTANAALFGEAGVVIFSGAVSNPVMGNRIFQNTGQGLDLGANGADGITNNDPLDADVGSGNNLQNFPQLTSANNGGASTTIAGTLLSTPSTQFRIEYFSVTTMDNERGGGGGGNDQGANGEGRQLIGTENVTTAVGSGSATLNFVAPVPVPAGQFVTATATNLATGDTSEFSNSQVVTGASTAAQVTVAGSVRDASGYGIRSVRVRLTDAEGNPRIVLTNAFGNFKFSEVVAGQTYVVSVTSKAHTFESSSQLINPNQELTEVNFVAVAPSSSQKKRK